MLVLKVRRLTGMIAVFGMIWATSMNANAQESVAAKVGAGDCWELRCLRLLSWRHGRQVWASSSSNYWIRFMGCEFQLVWKKKGSTFMNTVKVHTTYKHTS